MLQFTGERLVPGAANCEPTFASKMYHEHAARYLFAAQSVKGKRVLDVGCGVGYGSALLADAGATEVVAFDLSPEAIAHASANFARASIRYSVAAAEHFQFGQFDIVTCFELIEHVSDQSAVMASIVAALEPDGIAFVSTPRPRGDSPRSAFHVHELTFAEFRALMEQHFRSSRYWFEANQYGSRIDTSFSSGQAGFTLLEPTQFGSQLADYFVVIGSNGNELPALRAVHVVGDDTYVLNLEHDVDVLKRDIEHLQESHAALTDELEARSQVTASLIDANSRLQRHADQADAARDRALRLRTAADEHVRAMTATVSWRATKPLRSLRRMSDGLAQVTRRVLEARRKHGFLRLVALLRSRGITSMHRRIAPRSDPWSEIGLTEVGTLDNADLATVEVVFLVGCWEGQSKRYRVANLADGLREAARHVLVLDEADSHVLIEYGIFPRRLVVFRAPLAGRADQQRELFSHVRRGGGLVIADFDDLVFDPSIIHEIDGFRMLPERERPEYIQGVLGYRSMVDEADLVTCPTEFLANCVRQMGRPARVIRNSLDLAQMRLADELTGQTPRRRDVVEIAYFSGSNTHQADFAQAAGSIERVLAERPQTVFTVVGHLDLPDSWRRFGRRVRRLGFMPYLDLLRATAMVDINIAPLVVGNDFCEGKSELKIFEAGVVGVPTVASATASYSAAVTDGVDGFLASTADEWYEKLRTLIDDSELRKSMGSAARERSTAHYTYRAAASEFVSQLDLEPPARPAAAPNASPRRVSWIVPELIVGGGGHRNIFRAAYQLEQLGYEIEIYFNDSRRDSRELERLIHAHFYPLHAKVACYDGNIDHCDVLFATHWSTVKPALDNRERAREVMYFVQDFEPLFYPMGSEYLLAENTYRQGLYHITTGSWCEQILKNNYGADADHFQFPIDTSIYFPQKRTNSRRRILFFAKPEMPRRCFSLGLQVLEEFHRLRPDVEKVFFGSPAVDRESLRFPVTVAGILDLEGLANLYCNADLGLVFSPTNPSLVPYEMMACGLPVVDLQTEAGALNYGKVRNTVLLTDIDPLRAAAQMADLLAEPAELHARSLRGREFVGSFPTEHAMGARIAELIVQRLAAREAGGHPVVGELSGPAGFAS
jgi:glycosyltransferase involved in cell wall biosynthesis/SAM-dependent methyltransferase